MMIDIYEFLNSLKAKKIHFTLGTYRENSIMFQISVPGERWECELFQDGNVEIEIFKSDGAILGEEAMTMLFQKFTDE